MNTTPTMTLERERTDAAASAPRFASQQPDGTGTGSFRTVEPRIEVTAPLGERYEEILTPEALRFLAELHDRFAHTRHDLLAVRLQTRVDAANGRDPKFLPETAWIRNDSSWRVAGTAPGLEDRRVEITGPTDRKMAINALNSGAKVWLADQEDATSPTWGNVIEGQLTLFDFLRGNLEYTSPEGKEYRVTAGETPTIVMRPRGWHLTEKHIRFHDRAGRDMHASGSLVDFGLYFFHNAKERVARKSGIYLYLPKMESHLEARLWNDVFVLAQNELGVPQGTVKATVLIETILASFEMDEILHELREHSAGLNAGRWDYIFSCIKKLRSHREFCLADRALVTMTTHFMKSYAELLIKTCHRRNIHAMGGMAAQIPVKNDEKANAEAFAKVKIDKEREANYGHDGTWVAHPGLVGVAKEAFDRLMPAANQIATRKREDVKVTAADLLRFEPEQPITEKGLRLNVNVAIQYIGAWLAGQGAVPIFNLMEDAATAEISRSQVWQWMRSPKGVLDDGRKVSKAMVAAMVPEELAKIRDYLGDAYRDGKYDEAASIFEDLVDNDTFVEFLTLPAYERID